MYNGKFAEYNLTEVSLSNELKRGFFNLRSAKNIKVTKDGISKVPGLRLFGAFAESVISLGLQNISGSVKRLLSASDGKIYKEVSGDIDNVTLASGLDLGREINFLQCGREIFSADAKQLILGPTIAPRGLTGDGTTAPLLTNIPTDWAAANPTAAILHDGRTAAWLLDRLYFSTLEDHFDFVTGAPPIVTVDNGFADKITAAISYLPTSLFVFKYPLGVYSLDTSDITADIIPETEVTKAIGCVGARAVCQVPGGIAVVTATGEIAYFQATNTSEKVDITYLTSSNNDVRERLSQIVDTLRLETAQLVYDDKSKTLIYTFTSKESDALNDKCYSFQIDNQFNITEEFIEDSYHTILPYFDPSAGRYYLQAGQSGSVWYRDPEVFSIVNGAGVTTGHYYIDFETSLNEWLDSAGVATSVKEKRFDWIELEGVIRGHHTFTVSVAINGAFNIDQNILIENGGAVFDTSVFDDATFAGAGPWSVKREICARGRTIALRLSDLEIPDSDFLLTKCRVYYQDGDIGGSR